jgi:TRAP-type C4-dicarboxylate transport system permease small subunit
MNLDWLYRGCGMLAALCLVIIATLIILQIIGRLLGFIIPSADDIAGYCMAASIFLALADTLREGGHIRVMIVIGWLPASWLRVVELFNASVGVLFSGYFAWYTIIMVWQTYQFGEISQGYLPIPLWIPQSTMAFGLFVLFLAFVEEWTRIVRGLPPHYAESGEAARTE